MRRLDELTDRLRRAGLLRGAEGSFDDIRIDHLAGDSRQVRPGGLFIAVRGVEADGHLFIDKAVQNGAIAVVCEAVPDDRDARYPGIAFVHVRNSRAALAELAAAYYDDPARSLQVVGVTGTNGKTTVTFLIHHALTALGGPCGLIGTVSIRIGREELETTLTTPDPLEIQRLLRRMVDAGCGACAMEVSSHALDQDRVRSVHFDAAVFMNLTQDHLDYHKTFEAYRDAKRRLFDDLKPAARAIYNADDPTGVYMVSETRASKRSFALEAPADVRAEIVANSMDGLTLQIEGHERHFRLVGRFNAYNLLAAYAALRALGRGRDEALDALEKAPPVPGRFEILPFGDGTRVVVDYAHTPDALENVLRTIVETKDASAELWCLFGCGGDRDREKRPLMAAAAEKYADHVIVTSDNPRTEDPARILDDVRAGLSHPESAHFVIDRAQAIAAAARLARPGDIVLVAGKGHETYQIIGTQRRPFDDRQHVRAAFAASHAGASDQNTTG